MSDKRVVSPLAASTESHPALADTVASDPRMASGVESELPRGTALARYVVLGKIGDGGMGVVYAAYDPQLDRRVAVKLLRTGDGSGSDSGGVARARLLREAQALARLSHPHVIAVHDAGTFEGRVFVAMEIVEGGTLRDWVAAQPRSWREIVAMFVQAGRGLAAAHAAGLVHRDFKPDNVLVGKDGRARVVDFGLARAGQGDGAEQRRGDVDDTTVPPTAVQSLETPLTMFGALLGTPRYMAPEQFAREPTDARTDQFSFCVSLYEALYEQAPFAGETFGALAATARAGRVSPPPAGRAVPGHVHAAILRGLSADPGARFPSMDALLDALLRDPGAVNRRWLVAAAGTLLAVAAGGGVARAMRSAPSVCPTAAPELAGVWDDSRERAVHDAFRATGKPYAEDAFRETSRALDAYAASWVRMHDDACRATRVRGEQSEELLDLRMACLARRLDALRASTDLLVRADATAVEHAVTAATSLPSVDECADTEALRAPLRLPPQPEARARIAELRRRMAEVDALEQAGDLTHAEEQAHALSAEAEKTGYKPLEAETLELEGRIVAKSDDGDRALPLLQRAVSAAIAGRHETVETDAWIDLVRASAWGTHRAEGHDFAEHAAACLDRSPDDSRLAWLLMYRGILAQRSGKLDEAIDLEQRGLSLQERLHGPDAVVVASALTYLGTALHRADRDEEALERQRRAVAIFEQRLGPQHPDVAAALNNMANSLRALGRLDEALATYRRSYDIKVTSVGPEKPATATTLANIAIVLASQGKLEEALATERQALEIRRRALGDSHPDVALSLENMAEMLLHLKRPDEVPPLAQEALEIRTHVSGTDSTYCLDALDDLALAYAARHDAARALPPLERAARIADAGKAVPEDRARLQATQAFVLWDIGGDAARARALALQARAFYEKAPATYAADIAELDAALSRH